MRRFIVAGNWKMHKTREEAVQFAFELIPLVADVRSGDIVLCPPFTALEALGGVLRGSSIFLGAQNMHAEPKGAFTGEIAAPMLLPLGVTHVILGHSERRQFFGETDESVNRKVRAALQHGLVPIVCVGETLEQREAGRTEAVVGSQLKGAFKDVGLQDPERLVVAYEPVWAIGTGRNATPELAQQVHAFVRARLTDLFGSDVAGKVRIQYGGSVKPDNAADLMRQPDIDGALVGGASLEAVSFAEIVRSARPGKSSS
jgi:triosephosphate isomerase